MKSRLFILLFAAAVFLSLSVRSQSCQPCSISTTLPTPGFIGLDSIPCIVQGEPYSYTIPFHMFSTLVVYGDTLNVDSVHILDITNLPCGLCWSTGLLSQPLNTFVPNQNGCVGISGTTMDTTGQFKLTITLYGYFGGTAKAVLPATLDTDGVVLIVRVISPTGTCQPVDTSTGANTQTTSGTRCATAVNDIPGYISSFGVYPNPVSSASVVSYTAMQGDDYTLKLTDVTGKALRVQQLHANAGNNKTDLPCQNLPAGIYFISIGNEEGMITRKLLVAD